MSRNSAIFIKLEAGNLVIAIADKGFERYQRDMKTMLGQVHGDRFNRFKTSCGVHGLIGGGNQGIQVGINHPVCGWKAPIRSELKI